MLMCVVAMGRPRAHGCSDDDRIDRCAGGSSSALVSELSVCSVASD